MQNEFTGTQLEANRRDCKCYIEALNYKQRKAHCQFAEASHIALVNS